MPESGAGFLLAFVGLVVIVLLVLLQLTRLGYLIRATIPDRPRRRMFIASVSFLITFVGVRLLVHRIVNHEGHLQWVVVRGMHIHHLVWGILILLLVGYGWLLDLGPVALADVDLSRAADGGELRSGRGAHAG